MKEKNSSKAEMVNAFVLNTNIQASAIEQLQLLKEDRSPVVIPVTTSSGIEQLLPALSVAMERSGVSKAAIKLVPNIIAVRDSQSDRKFDTWETIVALKIKGLGAGIVKGIIEKLK